MRRRSSKPVRIPNCSALGVGLTQVEGSAFADIALVPIQPLVSTLPAKIAQLLEEAPRRVEARGGCEGIQPCAAMDAVHEHTLVLVRGKLNLIDQAHHKVDRS